MSTESLSNASLLWEQYTSIPPYQAAVKIVSEYIQEERYAAGVKGIELLRGVAQSLWPLTFPSDLSGNITTGQGVDVYQAALTEVFKTWKVLEPKDREDFAKISPTLLVASSVLFQKILITAEKSSLVSLMRKELQKDFRTLPLSLLLDAFSKMQALSLERRDLTSLPESLGALSELRILVLNWNNLSSLPFSIGNLTNLMRLELNHNNLETLPSSIIHLKNLTCLDIRNNPLIPTKELCKQLILLKTKGCEILCDLNIEKGIEFFQS